MGAVGVAANYSRPRVRFGNDSARVNARSWQVGAYGSFDMGGRRFDDANDRIPHEHRRSLRATRVLMGWLNVEGLAVIGSKFNEAAGTNVEIAKYQFGIYGTIVVLMMLFRPTGLIPERLAAVVRCHDAGPRLFRCRLHPLL